MKTKTWKDAFTSDWVRKGVSFNSSNKNLTSLKGAPANVGGYFDCSYNELTSLKGVPSYIAGSLYCDHNKLTSLKDIHIQIRHIGGFASFKGNPITSHVLGLLLIEGLQQIVLDNREVQEILKKRRPSKGIESALLAQEELIMAGYEEYAQL